MSKNLIPAILFWITWVLISVVGLSIGLAIGLNLMGADWTYRPFFILIGFAIGGLLTGVGQWLLLRRRVKATGKWILATLLGLPLGFFIGFWVSMFWLNSFTIATVAGTFTGALQWFSMHKTLKGSIKWVLVSALSWGLGVTGASFIFESYRDTIKFNFGYGNYASLGIMIGLIVGAISGIFVESTLVTSKNSSSAFQNAS